MNRWLALGLIAAAVAAVATAASVATIDASDRYGELEQPSWAPPSWVFGPMWTALYAAMAFAGWRIYQTSGSWTSRDMTLFWAQLAINGFWSPIFFAWELRGLALAWILALDALVALIIWRHRGKRSPVMWLLLPYQGWILFASALNASVWLLNRS